MGDWEERLEGKDLEDDGSSHEGIFITKQKKHLIIALNSKEWPAVSQKMLPTLMEIFKSLQKDEKVTDEQYAKWGKALIKDNRQFFK